MSSIPKTTLAFILLCALAIPAGSAPAQDDAGEGERRDNTMGTPGAGSGIRIGTDEKGGNTISVEPQPSQQQQAVPYLGPIIVTPEVDQYGGRPVPPGPYPPRPPQGPGQKPQPPRPTPYRQ